MVNVNTWNLIIKYKHVYMINNIVLSNNIIFVAKYIKKKHGDPYVK